MIDTTHCTVCGQEFYGPSYNSNIYSVWEIPTDPDGAQEPEEEILVLCDSCWRAAAQVLKIFMAKKVTEK